jgi:hypothetical protein
MATHNSTQLNIRRLRLWVSQWRTWGDRPSDVPSNPNETYANEGWVSWPDWLGYGEGKPAQARGKDFLSFEAAREVVRAKEFSGAEEVRRHPFDSSLSKAVVSNSS